MAYNSLQLPSNFSANFTLLKFSSYRNGADPWDARVQTAIIFTVIAAIGVVINALPIYLTATTKLRYNNVNILIAHLSVADLVVCLIFAVGQNFYILYRDRLPAIGCQWLGFVNASCGFQVFIFPAVLSLNRYVSLYQSAHYDRIYTRRNIGFMILGSWVFVSTILMTFAATGHTGWDEDNQHCCVMVQESVFWTVYFWIVCMGPVVGMGDLTVMFCNWRIYKKLTNHSESQQLTNNVIKQNKELLYFLIIEMIVPAGFHSTYLLAKFAYPNRLSLLGKRFFSILYLINSTLRSIVMMTMLKPLRSQFLRVFCGRKADNFDWRSTKAHVSKASQMSMVRAIKVYPLSKAGLEKF